MTDVKDFHDWQIWKLIPINVGAMSNLSQSSSGTLGLGSPILYDGEQKGQPISHSAEFERDGFGTIVTELTTVVTTTRRKYRVDDA